MSTQRLPIAANKGMMPDIDPSLMPEGGYLYALNAAVEQHKADAYALQNDGSNKLVSLFPAGYHVLGRLSIVEEDLLLVWLYEPNTKSGQIGYIKYTGIKKVQVPVETKLDCSDCNPNVPVVIPVETLTPSSVAQYTKLTESKSFNWDLYSPVQATYKIADCALEVYFIDGRNPDRYLYIDTTSTLAVVPELLDSTNQLAVDRLSLQPIVVRPTLEIVSIEPGGSLKSGVYQFLVAYSTVTGEALTPYWSATSPVPIATRNDQGLDTYTTDRSIRVQINGISQSTSYRYINIVVVETLQGNPIYKKFGTYPITQQQILYTGDTEQFQDVFIPANEIFQKYPIYKFSHALAKSNDYLFRADLEEYPLLNLQRAVSTLRPKWLSMAMPEGLYADPEVASKFRGYMRDEVYALGIVFELELGEDTQVFPLIGRASTDEDMRTLTTVEKLDAQVGLDNCQPFTLTKKWQVYNTGSVTKTYNYALNQCSPVLAQEGEFGYHESEERYPLDTNIWGTLAGTPIRHFRFPDSTITSHQGGDYNLLTYQLGFKQVVFPIGVTLEATDVARVLDTAVTQGLITNTERKRITGYRIVRGNRAGQKSVVAKGLLYDMWSYVKDGRKTYYPNYPYNDLRPDDFIAKNDFVKGKVAPVLNTFLPENKWTFHSPDTHFTEPPSASLLKLENIAFGIATGKFSLAQEQAKYKLLTKIYYDQATAFGVTLASVMKINNQTEQEASNIGASIGSAIGTAAGGPLGATIGGVAGSMLGGLFANNLSGPFELIVQSLQKTSVALMNAEKLIQLYQSFTPSRNYALQYNSVGDYFSSIPVENSKGIKQRPITTFSYLKPEVNSVSERQRTVFINNWHRESSVYVSTGTSSPLPNPSAFGNINDTSRLTLGKAFTSKALDQSSQTNVVSYYASVKNYRPRQYGTVYDVEYIETSGQSIKVNGNEKLLIFGGDTFIGRFALKRKMSFFQASTYLLPDYTDFYYSDYANVGYPVYYLNTQGTGDYYVTNPKTLLQPGNINVSIWGTLSAGPSAFLTDLAFARQPQVNLDSPANPDQKGDVTYRGYMYLYNYGIPYFLCESDVNLDLRVAKDSKSGDFYPRQQDLDYWLQEKNVSPREDNTYFYDKTYSKQNKESVLLGPQASYDPTKVCHLAYPNRVIYSEQANTIDVTGNKDQWRTFKANSYYDFSRTLGDLVSVEGIEDDKILARFEKAIQVYRAYVTIPTNSENIQIGTGGMFQSKPQQYAFSDLGYAGSEHKAIIHTEFGHVFVDAKRGQVFLLSGNSLDELTKEGMKNWFNQNLPFVLSDQFNLPKRYTDNNYHGIGISLSYDRNAKRFFLTKLDYQCIDSTVTLAGNDFYKAGVKISLQDERYFLKLHFTVSYNFVTKSWISFHSFVPHWSVDTVNTMLTGRNPLTSAISRASLWGHGLWKGSYQVYYGNRYPFILDVIGRPKSRTSQLGSIQWSIDTKQWLGFDSTNETQRPGFDKMIVTSDQGSTGVLEVIPRRINDLTQLVSYPRVENNAFWILAENRLGMWNVNQFHNAQSSLRIPKWLNANPASPQFNQASVRYVMPNFPSPLWGEWYHVRLQNSLLSTQQILFNGLVLNYNPVD